jgi:hypothetical protein
MRKAFEWKCSRMRNDVLSSLYSPCTIKLSQVKEDGLGTACTGENEDAYEALVGKPREKRPLGVSSRRLR